MTICLHCCGGWEISRSTCHNYIGEDVHLHQVTCWQLGILASMTSTYITSMGRTVHLFFFSHCFFSNKNFPKLCKVQLMSCPNTVSSRCWPISVKWGWFSQRFHDPFRSKILLRKRACLEDPNDIFSGDVWKIWEQLG